MENTKKEFLKKYVPNFCKSHLIFTIYYKEESALSPTHTWTLRLGEFKLPLRE